MILMNIILLYYSQICIKAKYNFFIKIIFKLKYTYFILNPYKYKLINIKKI